MRDLIKYAANIAQGNPRAMTGFMKLLEEESKLDTFLVTMRLDQCPSIRGTNFYVLYSDLCNKDIKVMSNLCSSDISNEVLEDACSRQDYSGKALVEDYL